MDGTFNGASNFIDRRDPLTLDLDADGLETLGIDPANPILFDHDGDGNKTATGWVAPDDGFLVLDRNGNGTIDAGAELFGDSTPLSTGGTAADGFAALAQEDTNLDGKVDALDARFANLRIWRDLNSDGISQTGELSTLAANNIAALNVAKTENTTLLANGNVIADLGTYVKTDGTTGTLGDTAQLGDLDLAENTFISQFTDSIPISAEAAALPDMQGSGQVRDLREAASLSASLATALGNYAAAATRDAQQTQLDTLIKTWSDTSTLATTATGAYAGHALTLNFAGITNGSAEYQAWLDKLTVLERFNGRTFQAVPTGTAPVTLNFSAGQMSLLDQSYAALRDSVYGALVVQTRFKPLIESIDLVLNESGIALDFSGVEQGLQARIDANPAEGLKDLIEFNRFSNLSGAGWNEWGVLENALNSAPSTVVDAVLTEMKLAAASGYSGTSGNDYVVATTGADTLSGNTGDDVLFGWAGNDTLNGGAGADSLIGGAGNDTLNGEDGNDTYLFGKGDGQDVIGTDYDTLTSKLNTLQFKAGVTPDEIVGIRSGGNLVLSIAGTTDSVTLSNFYDSDNPANSWNSIQQAKFSDGTILNLAAVSAWGFASGTAAADILNGTINADIINGGAGTDTLSGRAGDDLIDGGVGTDTLNGESGNDALRGGADNDILWGGAGNDTLDGGAGNDTLNGEGGNDTYLFATGAGVDRITDYDTTAGNTDVVQFSNVASTALTALERQGNDLVLKYGTADQVSVSEFFYSSYPGYKIEQIKFSDGVTWGLADIQLGSVSADTLIGGTGDGVLQGYAGNDTLNGNDGNDYLDGGLDSDTLIGGLGNDTYVVDNAGDIVTETSTLSTEIDTVQSSVTTTLGANVENLTLTGAAYSIDGTGNALANVLRGNEGYNILSGLDGNDTIYAGYEDLAYGGAGNDTLLAETASDFVYLYGEAGDDILTGGVAGSEIAGGLGNDLIMVSAGNFNYLWGDDAYNNTTGGNDTIIGGTGIDYAYGGAGNDTLSGNDGNDLLSGQLGADLIYGGAGNDTLSGGLDVDTLVGGTGDDTYNVDNIGDIVTELAGEGTDTLRTSVSRSLDANVENLVLNGTAAINGTGNELANTLSGNGAANVLDGGLGIDTLIGGLGNDTYRLGRGYASDTVVENDATAGNTDIAQFLTGVAVDQIWFQKVGNNLETSIIGTSDKLVVKDWYLGTAYHVEQFKTADGAKTLLDSNVANLVNAMASFAPPAAGQTTLPSNYQTALAPVIAANWQ